MRDTSLRETCISHFYQVQCYDNNAKAIINPIRVYRLTRLFASETSCSVGVVEAVLLSSKSSRCWLEVEGAMLHCRFARSFT